MHEMPGFLVASAFAKRPALLLAFGLISVILPLDLTKTHELLCLESHFIVHARLNM